MAMLEILNYPDPRLRITAVEVTLFNDALQQLVKDLFETMYTSNGLGLAATQVGVAQRIFVMDVSQDKNEPFCVINPQILTFEGKQFETEGCLSVTEAYDRVERAAFVHLKAFNEQNEPFELHAEGLLSSCIQHETDHLNGILFIDHLSRLKQERIRKKTHKLLRRQ